MSRKKVSSATFEAALQRLASLKSIAPKLDFGNDVSIENYEKLIDEVREAMEQYNTMLSAVDERMELFHAKEKELATLSERLLLGVAASYGKESNEYVKAGGTRKSESRRKASAEKKTKPA